MFRAKRNKQQAPRAESPAPTVSANGYQVTELPTFHGRKRKIVVYTTDSTGRIVKTLKK